jgi:hypothetical protein
MEDKMSCLPSFPLFDGLTDGRYHEVEIDMKNFATFYPSDGFFLQLTELNSYRELIEVELAKEWE